MKNSSKILGTVALVAATLIFIAVAIKVQQDWQELDMTLPLVI